MKNKLITVIMVSMLTTPLVGVTANNSNSVLSPIFYVLLQGKPFLAEKSGKLNDTGIDWSAVFPIGNNDNQADCFADNATPDQQDCHFGRDATHNDDSDGHSGFSFVKLDASGEILANNASQWSCVGDQITGLMWEVKKNQNNIRGNSLHDADDEYTWFSTDGTSNGGRAGDNGASKNVCYAYTPSATGTYCNTQAFVTRVNAQSWCGHRDWRMPTPDELLSILDYSIDTSIFFPNTRLQQHWSNAPDAIASINNDRAWAIQFEQGTSIIQLKTLQLPVRLVRP